MTTPLATLPAADGFRMPAEWEPHARTYMIWPRRGDNWRLDAAPARQAFANVANIIAKTESLTVIVEPGMAASAAPLLSAGVSLLEAPTNDAWCRDTGPSFVTDAAGRVRGVDWRFNAWGGSQGGLYADWEADDALAERILAQAGVPRYRAPIVLEGGSIHVDGEGTLLTTEECLLNPNRNPGLSRLEIEAELRGYLGVETVIWLDQGLYNDETDGHIDNIACFARPGVVALTWCDDPQDPQYEISRDAWRRLSLARDARGRALEVVKLPMPGPLTMTAEEAAGITAADGSAARPAGNRLAASYANYYLANGIAVVPLLDPATDEAALDILGRLHPERRIIGVPAREILLGGGNIHCITQQLPAGIPG